MFISNCNGELNKLNLKLNLPVKYGKIKGICKTVKCTQCFRNCFFLFSKSLCRVVNALYLPLGLLFPQTGMPPLPELCGQYPLILPDSAKAIAISLWSRSWILPYHLCQASTLLFFNLHCIIQCFLWAFSILWCTYNYFKTRLSHLSAGTTCNSFLYLRTWNYYCLKDGRIEDGWEKA